MSDIQELVSLMRAQLEAAQTKREVSDSVSILEIFTKIGTGICLAGVLWLVQSVSTLQQQLVGYSVKQQQNTEIMKQLKQELDSKPSFSFDDFNRGISSLERAIQQHSIQLANRDNWMDEVRSKISHYGNNSENNTKRIDSLEREMELSIHGSSRTDEFRRKR